METRPTPTPKWNPLAIVSLLLVLAPFLLSGILGWQIFYSDRHHFQWLCFMIFTMGVVLGHVAVKRSKALQDGFFSRVTARAALTVGYFVLIFILASPDDHHNHEKGGMTQAINNCKQIITTLKIYAGDHQGQYPDQKVSDARTSNEVFRELFKAEVAENEFIFGSPNSSDGNPDGNIGQKPDFIEAVKPGENHWAITKGLTDLDSGNIPLVYESPADATWPPTWNPDYAGTTKPGRTWSGDKVIIGFNDGSVAVMPLKSSKGMHVGLRPHSDGTPSFPTIPGRKLEVLDVAR